MPLQDSKLLGDTPRMLSHLQSQLDMPLHINFGFTLKYDQM